MIDDGLYERVARILEQARGEVARSVNTAMVRAYWLVGREIVEVEQAGESRTSYGDEVMQRQSPRLAATHGKGFSVRNLRNMRQLYLAFPGGSALATIQQTASSGSSRLIQQTPSAGFRGTTSRSKSTPPSRALVGGNPAAEFPQELSWSHYLVLARVVKETARAFYEIEAARECWSVRQLERQIGSQLFERLANHRDPEEVLALARRGQEVAKPTDVIKDPFVLEFLDLGEPVALHERDVEQAIIDRLEAFLLEMGKGFCFVGRQKRLTVEGDHQDHAARERSDHRGDLPPLPADRGRAGGRAEARARGGRARAPVDGSLRRRARRAMTASEPMLPSAVAHRTVTWHVQVVRGRISGR